MKFLLIVIQLFSLSAFAQSSDFVGSITHMGNVKQSGDTAYSRFCKNRPGHQKLDSITCDTGVYYKVGTNCICQEVSETGFVEPEILELYPEVYSPYPSYDLEETVE